MRKHNNGRNRHKSANSEIRRLEEAIRRTHDKTERENLKQHIEHWIRTQNNHR